MAGKYRSIFKLVVISPKRLIYENEVESVSLKGDRSDFELLSYHFPILGALEQGDIVINQKERIPIKSGAVRFYANECTILVEEAPAELSNVDNE